MKLYPTSFSKTVSKGSLNSLYISAIIFKTVQNSKKGIFGYSIVTYCLITLLHGGNTGVQQKIEGVDPSMGITLKAIIGSLIGTIQ